VKFIYIFFLVFTSMVAEAETEINREISTDDIVNPEMLNSLDAVNILNLSGYYNEGRDIDRFMITSLPDEEEGVLFLSNGTTEVVENQILTAQEANELKFDPNENFEGNATFQYASVNINDEVDPNPATVTIPIVKKQEENNNTTTSVAGTSTTNSTTCSSCDDYNSSVPSLSHLSIFLIFLFTSWLGIKLIEREE